MAELLTTGQLARSSEEATLDASQLDHALLLRLFEEANRLIAESGLNVVISSLEIRPTSADMRSRGCRCVRTETKCYPYVDCQPGPDGKLIRTTRQQCQTECAQWECDT